MKPKIEVEVEPLSEARWARIEDRVLADAARSPASPEAPARSPRVPAKTLLAALGGFVVACALALGVVRLAAGPREAPPALHIATGESGSRAPVGSSEIEVGPRSEVVATGDDARGVVVVLERGSVTCEVSPRDGRPPFVVQAGEVRVRVIGTRFRVVRAANDVRVEVERGRVEVDARGRTISLRDGESWPEAAPPPPPPTAEPPPPSVTASAPRPPEPRATAAHADPSGDRAAYEGAARSEVSDPAGAMSAYRRLAAGGGPWAAPSLFAAGRLAVERGDRGTGRDLLREYLRRYPTGANAGDARVLLSRVE